MILNMKKLFEQYSYFVLHIEAPVVCSCKYEKCEFVEDMDLLKLYSGDFLFPICTMYIMLSHIEDITYGIQNTKADELKIKLNNDKEINILAYKKN